MQQMSSAITLVAMLGAVPAAMASPPACGIDVVFEGCTEYVGIGLVSMEQARSHVPSAYTVVEAAGGALLVVRVSACEAVSVDGKRPKAGKVAQVGISVTGPDDSADINNYTLFYVTDSEQLKGALTAAGVSAVLASGLSYEFDALGGDFDSLVDTPQVPRVALSGSAVPPGEEEETRFVASWWTEGKRGPVRMRTVFPRIIFSDATVTLTTSAGSVLEDLVGSQPFEFVVLDSYNAFDIATMEVTGTHPSGSGAKGGAKKTACE